MESIEKKLKEISSKTRNGCINIDTLGLHQEIPFDKVQYFNESEITGLRFETVTEEPRKNMRCLLLEREIEKIEINEKSDNLKAFEKKYGRSICDYSITVSLKRIDADITIWLNVEKNETLGEIDHERFNSDSI